MQAKIQPSPTVAIASRRNTRSFLAEYPNWKRMALSEPVSKMEPQSAQTPWDSYFQTPPRQGSAHTNAKIMTEVMSAVMIPRLNVTSLKFMGFEF